VQVHVGSPMRTHTQHCTPSDPEFGGGRHPLPRLWCPAICQESREGAILSTRHNWRVDFRCQRMSAPTLLEETYRDEGLRQSWTHDFGGRSRPVQPGVHSGCAEHSTRVSTEHEVYWTRFPSWYGPLYGPRTVARITTFFLMNSAVLCPIARLTSFRCSNEASHILMVRLHLDKGIRHSLTSMSGRSGNVAFQIQKGFCQLGGYISHGGLTSGW